MKRRKNSQRPPIWLRRLKLVKMELQEVSWPSPMVGFHQGLMLMAFGIEALHGNRKLMATFGKADARWVARWKEERAKIFSRRT